MALRRWSGLVVAAVVLLGACGSGGDGAATDTAEPSSADTSAVVETTPAGSEPTAEQAPGSLNAIGPTPAEIDPDGMKHSGIAASGEFTTNTVDIAPATQQPDVRTYVVHVETSTGLDANEVAQNIQQVLDSPRGWVGYRGVAFHLVADASAADFVLNLSSPPTVDIGCGALDTGGTWSCRVGNQVFLNVDRWWFATPTWNGYLLDDYRAYMINHEVGHYLGFGHVTCPVAGSASPVMQQQSITLNGCEPNPWPDVTGEKNG